MKTLCKRMSKKKKEECEAKLVSKIKLAGASFHDDESSSSGTDSTSSGRKHSSRHKVKSWAKLRKRTDKNRAVASHYCQRGR